MGTRGAQHVNSPFEVFAYFLFAYIVRQVSDPKMASLPNHYVANSSSFGNTPKHTGRAQRFHRGPTDSETKKSHTRNTRTSTPETAAAAETENRVVYANIAVELHTRAHRDDDDDTLYEIHADTILLAAHSRRHTSGVRNDDSDHMTIAAGNPNTENTEQNCTGILNYIFTSARPFRANSKKENKKLNKRNNNIKNAQIKITRISNNTHPS